MDRKRDRSRLHRAIVRTVRLVRACAGSALVTERQNPGIYGCLALIYRRLIVDEGVQAVTARLTEEWLEAVSTLADLGDVDDGHVSVFGMSMGARYGLPTAAALGTRLRCLVLGKFGVQEGPLMPAGLCAPGLTLSAARAITAPVLFHVQWDDALFPREGQFELFDAFASQEKRLHARAGPHDQTRRDDEALWQEFLRQHAQGGH